MAHRAQMFDLCGCLTVWMLDLSARIQLENMIIPKPEILIVATNWATARSCPLLHAKIEPARILSRPQIAR